MRHLASLGLLALTPLFAACDQTTFFSRNNSAAQDPVVQAAAQNSADRAVALAPDASTEVAGSARVQHLTGEDYVISQVQVGNFPCKDNVHVSVTADPSNPRMFLVEGKGFSYRMKPVTTKSGAIRLEDEEGGLVWLQVATKSMLMNQKAGKRLADACVSPRQIARAEELGAAPALPVAAAPTKAPAKPAASKAPAKKKAQTAKKTSTKTAAKPAAKKTATAKK